MAALGSTGLPRASDDCGERRYGQLGKIRAIVDRESGRPIFDLSRLSHEPPGRLEMRLYIYIYKYIVEMRLLRSVQQTETQISPWIGVAMPPWR
jgi:hypothetical protein